MPGTPGNTRLPADRLYLVGLVAVVLAGATIVYRRTRFGLASRGATESAVGVELLGYSAARLGATNWVIGAVVAGVFGVLLAPIAGLSPHSYSLLVVPALVAALAGRLVSTSMAVLAGLVLGMFQAQASRLSVSWDWLGPQAIRTVLPFVALVGVLVAFGTPVPPRGSTRTARLPAAPASSHRIRLVLALTLLAVGGTLALGGGHRTALVATMIGATLCLSLVVLTGFAGQVSLAQMTFAGVAGFVLSAMTSRWGVPFPIAPLLAVLAASACGVLVGLPSLRARGMTLAISTFGAALAIEELLFRNLSQGILATNAVAPARLFGVDLAATAPDGTPRALFGLFVAFVLVALALVVLQLRVSPLGQRLLAVRSNERAAAAAGINVGRTKLVAFGLSGSVAGVAGVLAGYQQGALSDQSFSTSRSLVVLAIAYLGGIGSVPGAVLGGLIMPGGLVPTVVDGAVDLGRYETLFAGLAVVAVARRNPEGLTATFRRRRRT